MRLVAAVCAVLAFAAAGAGAADAARCSASGMKATPQRGLPPAVARTRAAVVAAAVGCDYARLRAIAGKPFTFSYGSGRDAAAFWRTREAAGEPVLRRLVQLLSLPARRRGSLVTWPPAYRERPSAADWRALERVYPRAQVAAFRRDGVYYGLRVGITTRGHLALLRRGRLISRACKGSRVTLCR